MKRKKTKLCFFCSFRSNLLIMFSPLSYAPRANFSNRDQTIYCALFATICYVASNYIPCICIVSLHSTMFNCLIKCKDARRFCPWTAIAKTVFKLPSNMQESNVFWQWNKKSFEQDYLAIFWNDGYKNGIDFFHLLTFLAIRPYMTKYQINNRLIFLFQQYSFLKCDFQRNFQDKNGNSTSWFVFSKHFDKHQPPKKKNGFLWCNKECLFRLNDKSRAFVGGYGIN